MARQRRVRILPPLILVATSLAVATWFIKDPGPDSTSEIEASEHLTNRVWINKMPKGHRDTVRSLAFVEKKKKKAFGVVQAASRWRLFREAFLFSKQGNKVVLKFPQENKKVTLDAKTFKCNVKPFDLCLELKQGKRTLKLYSKKKWTFDETPAELAGVLNTDDYADFEALPADACADCIYGTPQWFLEAEAEL